MNNGPLLSSSMSVPQIPQLITRTWPYLGGGPGQWGSSDVSVGALSRGFAATGPGLLGFCLCGPPRGGVVKGRRRRGRTRVAGRPLTTPVVDRAPAMIELISRPAADLDAVSGLSREPGAGRLEGPPETSQEPLFSNSRGVPAYRTRVTGKS